MAIVRGDKPATVRAAGKARGALSSIKASRARGQANDRKAGTQDAQAPKANAAPTADRAQTPKSTGTENATKRMTGSHYDFKPIVRGTLHTK